MLRLLARLGALALAFAFAGCSAIVGPDTTRLGDDPDAGTPPPVDAGGTDTGMPPPGDGGGGPCTDGTSRCEGDVLYSCFGGTETPQDCQAMSAFCDTDHCQPWVCTPGDRECSPDGRSALVCSARGDVVMMQDCGDGFCSPMTNACVMDMMPVCPGVRRITPGESVDTNLCGQPDENTFNRAPGCDTSLEAMSGDETFVLELDRMTRLTIELTDIDLTRAIDTVLYIRRDCDEKGSQVACHDDVPCGASTVPGGPRCTGGVDVRQSRITLDLPAGRYYIIADAFERRGDGTSYTCGTVRLSVRPAG